MSVRVCACALLCMHAYTRAGQRVLHSGVAYVCMLPSALSVAVSCPPVIGRLSTR